MEKITTKPTTLHIALASKLILRKTTFTRLVFQSMLIYNPSEKKVSKKGRFLFQKKGKNEEWEYVKTAGLVNKLLELAPENLKKINTSASLQALKNSVMVRSVSKLIPADTTAPCKLSKTLCNLITFI